MKFKLFNKFYWYYNEVKHWFREFFISFFTITKLDLANSDFEYGDGLFIIIRQNIKGTKNIGIRIGKLDIPYYRKDGYYEDNDLIKFFIFFDKIKDKLSKVEIVTEFNQHTKEITKFVSDVKRLVNKNTKVIFKDNINNLNMFN